MAEQQQPREVPRREGENLILGAEQFQPGVEPPPAGISVNLLNAMQGNLVNQIPPNLETDSDDDYFHLVCHVDSNLKSKIERGEYVDLERLLPKTRFNDESRLE